MRLNPLIRPALLAPALALALSSCSSDPRSIGTTVVDSAGISIVTTGPIDTTEASQWHFPTEPALRIGVVDGDSVYQLFNVRSAFRRGDGSLVVANSGNREIRFYDRNGIYLRSAGRRGQGPGEYEFLAWAQPYRGDSIVSLDGATTRITISDAEGRYGRSVDLVAPGERPRARVVGTLRDGSFLAHYGEGRATSRDSTRVERSAVAYGLWSPDGEFVREFGTFVGDDQFIWADGRSVSVAPAPYGRMTTVSIFGERVLVADNAGPEIGVHAQNGRLATLIRAPWTRPPLSERAAETHREEQLAEIGTGPAFFVEMRRRSIEATPYPDLLPYYGTVVVDRDRTIWVQGPPIPNRDDDRWLAFSEHGTYAGWIAIPRSLTVTQMDGNMIVGVAVDDLEVQYVEVYQIERPQ